MAEKELPPEEKKYPDVQKLVSGAHGPFQTDFMAVYAGPAIGGGGLGMAILMHNDGAAAGQTAEKPAEKPAEKTCAACGASLPARAKFCTACGAAQPRYCPACGEKCEKNAAFCTVCGAKLP